MSDELDLFDQLANAEAPPVEGGAFLELPAKAWVVGKTTTAENGDAKPKINTFALKDGSGDFRQFSLGLITVGGDSNISDRMDGLFCFLKAPVDPRDDEPSNVISGRLTGLLNVIFAKGIGLDIDDKEERAKVRWQATLKALRESAQTYGLVPSQYEEVGGNGTFLAACAVAWLEEHSTLVLFKTRARSYEQDGEKKQEILAGSFEDFVPDNFKKRKVRLFESGQDEAPSDTETDISFD